MSEWVGACVGVWVCEWVRECVCVYWFLKSQIKCRINSDLLRLLTLSRSKPTSKKPTAMYIYMQICTSRYLQYCSLPFEHSWGIFDLDTPDLTGSEDHLVSEGTLHDTDMIRWYRSFYIISAPILMTKEVSKSECYQVHVPTILMFTPPPFPSLCLIQQEGEHAKYLNCIYGSLTKMWDALFSNDAYEPNHIKNWLKEMVQYTTFNCCSKCLRKASLTHVDR